MAGCSSKTNPLLLGSVYAEEHGGGYETILLPPPVLSTGRVVEHERSAATSSMIPMGDEISLRVLLLLRSPASLSAILSNAGITGHSVSCPFSDTMKTSTS